MVYRGGTYLVMEHRVKPTHECNISAIHVNFSIIGPGSFYMYRSLDTDTNIVFIASLFPYSHFHLVKSLQSTDERKSTNLMCTRSKQIVSTNS